LILISTDEDRPQSADQFRPFSRYNFFALFEQRLSSNKQSNILGYIWGARRQTEPQEWCTMSETDRTHLKHPDKVAEIIRLSVAEQQSDDLLYLRSESRTDLVFRYTPHLSENLMV